MAMLRMTLGAHVEGDGLALGALTQIQCLVCQIKFRAFQDRAASDGLAVGHKPTGLSCRLA